mmetsp:Transcript_113116/g.326825  ORF Transcript_113116/g.326825 Transcript_113116/m.326825 type:complete len:272 (-) Transcript_113116:131-946(-)
MVPTTSVHPQGRPSPRRLHAAPKSPIFRRQECGREQSPKISKFPGCRSRCTKPISLMRLMPRNKSAKSWILVSTLTNCSVLMTAVYKSESAASIKMLTFFRCDQTLDLTASMNPMECADPTNFRIISTSASVHASSSVVRGITSLTATLRPVRSERAMKTTPASPAAMYSTLRGSKVRCHSLGHRLCASALCISPAAAKPAAAGTPPATSLEKRPRRPAVPCHRAWSDAAPICASDVPATRPSNAEPASGNDSADASSSTGAISRSGSHDR